MRSVSIEDWQAATAETVRQCALRLQGLPFKVTAAEIATFFKGF